MSRKIHRKIKISIGNSKAGSSAVFLSLILAALMAICLALIYGVRESAVHSRLDGLFNLAGDSVLSEFDYHIQKEYGLFLLKGTDRELTEKMEGYLAPSIRLMKDVELERLNVSGSRLSAADPELVKEQLLEHARFAAAGEAADRLTGKEVRRENTMESRSLNHRPTIISLPSAVTPRQSLTDLASSIADKNSDVKEVFEAGTDNYLLNRYILDHFNDRSNMTAEGHFFRSEAEYILAGELSDRKNEKRVEMALQAMRMPLNLAHIYADPKKRSAVLTAAELLTPGAAAVATQLAIATTWAYAEADNDVELLWQGHQVPMVKDESSWALDLEGAMEGILGGPVRPPVEKGYDYQEYLQILLFFRDENSKIARIMDLIQINTRKERDGRFLIQEHALGIAIDAAAEGREYGYEKKY